MIEFVDFVFALRGLVQLYAGHPTLAPQPANLRVKHGRIPEPHLL